VKYTYKELKRMMLMYKIGGIAFAIFFVSCISSAVWMPLFYQPLVLRNVGVLIPLRDVMVVLDGDDKGKISNKEFYQTLNVGARKQIAETTPVVLVIQDDKVLSTYVLAHGSTNTIKMTFRPISESPIYFNYYQPPPMLANKFTETGDYSILTDYYVRQSIIDYRAF